MSLFAIADLHLSLGSDKPMDVFRGWQDYLPRLEKEWRSLVTEEDTVVIAGDLSWGMTLQEARDDFAFLNDLPGHKLILKGNHDYWWVTRRKMETFFSENGWTTLQLVHNDAVRVGDLTVCGSRGWFFDAESDADRKILLREVGRLDASITAAERLGGTPVVFLHYPPLFGDAVCEEILKVLTEHQVRRCYYGHLHGASIPKAFNGEKFGITFRLISCDALSFCPLKISG